MLKFYSFYYPHEGLFVAVHCDFNTFPWIDMRYYLAKMRNSPACFDPVTWEQYLSYLVWFAALVCEQNFDAFEIKWLWLGLWDGLRNVWNVWAGYYFGCLCINRLASWSKLWTWVHNLLLDKVLIPVDCWLLRSREHFGCFFLVIILIYNLLICFWQNRSSST